MSVALANPALQPLMPQPLKAGLPLCWLSAASMGPADAAQLAAASGGFNDALPAVLAQAGQGTKAGRNSKAELARQLAGACRAMAEWLEDEELGPRVVEAAADAVMAEDFMRNRRGHGCLVGQSWLAVCCSGPWSLQSCSISSSKAGVELSCHAPRGTHASSGLLLPAHSVCLHLGAALQASATSRAAAAAWPCTHA